MKKEYVRPEMAVEEVILESMLASSTNIGDGEGIPFSNDREEDRSWGNLWD